MQVAYLDYAEIILCIIKAERIEIFLEFPVGYEIDRHYCQHKRQHHAYSRGYYIPAAAFVIFMRGRRLFVRILRLFCDLPGPIFILKSYIRHLCTETAGNAP